MGEMGELIAVTLFRLLGMRADGCCQTNALCTPNAGQEASTENCA